MIDLSSFNNLGFQRGVPIIVEILWWFARSILFASWLPVPSLFKTSVLRLFGAQVGKGVVIRSRVDISFPWRIEIGNYSWIGDEVKLLSLDKIVIGANSCISQRAFLCTGSHDFSKESFDLITAPICIGESCWVGAQSFVGPGVSMGKGSCCLAGAVVVKDVSSGVTVGGVPAKPIEGRKGIV